MATFTLPSDPSPGNVAPASWGDAVRDALSFLANPPACRVYNSAGQSPANGAETALAFNSERYDTDAMHSTSVNTGRITFNTAGLYVVTGSVAFAGNATGIRQVGIRLVGGGYLAVELDIAPGVQLALMSVSTVFKFTVGQYVELVAYQTSGGALAVNSAANYSPEFSATWVGLG